MAGGMENHGGGKEEEGNDVGQVTLEQHQVEEGPRYAAGGFN